MQNIRKIDKNKFYSKKTLKEKIKFLLQYGILAPSTHNSQPWLFKLIDNSCQIYSNSLINLKEADPTKRELYISIGCCVENIILAGKYFNIYKTIEYHFKDNHIAEIFFDQNQNNKLEETPKELGKLIEMIPKRLNIRGAFKKGAIATSLISRLRHIHYNPEIEIKFIIEWKKIQYLANLTAEGIKKAHQNYNFRRELAYWIRNNFTKKLDGLPGYSLKIPAPISLILPTAIRYFNLGKILSLLNYKSIISAPLICIVCSKFNNKKVWLDSGRISERIMLELQLNNLKTSIFSAAIEINGLSKKIQETLKTDLIPQFLFVGGYSDEKQRLSPRIPIDKKLLC